MEFKLVRTYIRELKIDHPGEGVELPVEQLKFGPIYRDDEPREFAVGFNLQAPLLPNASLMLRYMAVFETSEDISEEFRQSHFPKVNAAAVAYPYVRAFVAQFSALAGMETYTLPIRNFIKVAPKAASPAPTDAGASV